MTGNRSTGPTTATAYTIDQGNQLKAKTGTTYTYDNNGNQITKIDGTTTWRFTYDGENRLVKSDKTIGTITTSTTYKYDPFGNRIEKTVNGTTTKYLYDGANILYEYNGSNAMTTRYTHNLAIDDPLGFETGGKLYAYHKDTLGSIRAITDNTEKTVTSYSYDSFGATTQTGTLIQPYGYTGRELDKETGLYYYRARYYDPSAGRFVSRDPISFAGGDVNLYGYVQNNPVNFIDPSGLDAINDTWSLWNKIKKPFDTITDGINQALQLKIDYDKFNYLKDGLRKDKETRETLLASDLGADPCKLDVYNRVNERFNEKLIEMANLLSDYGLQIDGAISKKLIGIDLYSDFNSIKNK